MSGCSLGAVVFVTKAGTWDGDLDTIGEGSGWLLHDIYMNARTYNNLITCSWKAKALRIEACMFLFSFLLQQIGEGAKGAMAGSLLGLKLQKAITFVEIFTCKERN